MQDVVILGAGMAGMACARTLMQKGCAPLLIAPHRAVPCHGETLSFRAGPFLDQLGWHDLLDDDTAVRSAGRFSVWGVPALRRNDAYSETTLGWHIDRPLLEARMAGRLDAAGLPRRDTEARALSRAASHITLQLADGSSVDTRHVIDCSGRAAVTSGAATPLRRLDRLVACHALFDLDGDVEAAPATVVEAVAEGWWYMTVLPGHRCLLGLFTDSDLLPSGLRADPAPLADLLAQTRVIAPRLESLGLDLARSSGWQVAPASTATHATLIDRMIIRAGDAASALDPLGANGLATALWSGIQAADSVMHMMAGNDEAAHRYERSFLEGIASFLATQHAMYAAERRFGNAPFWQRRQHELSVAV